MAQNVTARTDKEHREALDHYVEHGHADSRSEAVRQTSQAELARMGYLNGATMDTSLRQTVREFARLFSYGGIFWFGFTILWSVEIRLAGVFLLCVGLVLFGVDQLLAKVEPRVTDRINRLFSRGETA
jgi:hypothetical protein